MKRIATIIIILVNACFNLKAQLISDSVSMQANYTSQVFYSLDNGVVSSVSINDWNIAFSVSGNGAAGSSILLNEANSTLWAYPGDTASWNSFDTTGFKYWKRLLNTDTSWTNGAFNVFRGAGGTFDMGWGILNPLNNYWTFGDSLYLIKLNDNTYRKLWIVSLKTGVWNFKYANIDGSNPQQITISKSSFTNKNFAYVSLVTNTVLDKEPSNNTWDLTFYKHVDYVAGQFVTVSGIFSNKKVASSKINTTGYTAAINASAPLYGYNRRINNIGREWKNYSSATGWKVYDSIAYFVYDQDSTNLYRLVFTKFGGAGNGKTYFVKENLGFTSVNEYWDSQYNCKAYPSPFNQKIYLSFDNSSVNPYLVAVYNISGQKMEVDLKSQQFTNGKTEIDAGGWANGMYFVHVISDNKRSVIKVIKQ